MILADTSAWIDFLRGSERGRDLRRRLRDGQPIACTEPVMMEVLAGARTADEYEQVRSTLLGAHWLPFDPVADFEAAAQIYAMSRSVGVVPGGLVDCLIVAVALRTDARVLTYDGDFARLATVVPLQLAD